MTISRGASIGLVLLTTLTRFVVRGDEGSSFWANIQSQFEEPNIVADEPDVIVEEGFEFWANAESAAGVQDLPWDAACITNLNSADADNDDLLSRTEYLTFIQLQSECEAGTITDIPQSQLPFYVGLACLCLSKPGSSFSCCTAENSRIEIPTKDEELRVICNLKYLGGSFCGELPAELTPTVSPTQSRGIGLQTTAPTPSISVEDSDSPSDVPSDVPTNVLTFLSSDSPTSSTAACSLYPVCANLDGNCCPSKDNIFLDCCNATLTPSDVPSDTPSTAPSVTLVQTTGSPTQSEDLSLSDAPSDTPSDISSDIASDTISLSSLSSSPSSAPVRSGVIQLSPSVSVVVLNPPTMPPVTTIDASDLPTTVPALLRGGKATDVPTEFNGSGEAVSDGERSTTTADSLQTSSSSSSTISRGTATLMKISTTIGLLCLTVTSARC